MYCKAMLFKDAAVASLILSEADQASCKRLGRQVRGYVDPIWAVKRLEYAFTGGVAKYGQNHDLLEFLLATGQRELVEASPFDSLWGIGMDASDPRISDRTLWGSNLQGKTNMRLRQYFQEAMR